MLFYYRINGSLTVGGPWFRSVVDRAPTGVLLKSSKAFPPYHPTTKMCLRLMVQNLEQQSCQDLVDVGCGSGILALAGLKLGVKRAVAVDLDHRAIITSRANAALNHVEQQLLLIRGSTEAVDGSFDMVLANLPTQVLREKLPELLRLSRSGGSLVISGFQDLDRYVLEKEMIREGLSANRWLSEDLVFFGYPPTGSFTWMAALAQRREELKA
ncbi:MAG: 50S ribosomal protein L11 methyltransferase [Deltaproteobacteria bacterium]|nr:50S ribosomal protein L11 methyltransferase [Deltaproteobacteria bacterium]